MVAVQARRFEGVSGKAEIPGVEESISSINSFWSLDGNSRVRMDYLRSRVGDG